MNAPKKPHVLEGIRERDGALIRFDTKTGTYGVKHKDGTIGTMFKPSGGVKYFERQFKSEK